MAAAVGLACLVMLPVTMHSPTAYATERGEIRMVPLGDGSTATLNTITRIRVRYDGAQRLVTLHAGEVWFEVVRDPARPFVVEVDGRRLTAHGDASFLVRKLDGLPLHVSVHEGHVDLPAAGDGGGPRSTLDTSRRALLPSSGPGLVTGPLPRAELVREIAWREGRIAFHGETLAEAAAAFDRYSDIRIVIDDRALAREPVTGLFAANDPVGFGRAIGGVFNAEARIVDGDVVIARAH
jgi:transmembrane sensor